MSNKVMSSLRLQVQAKSFSRKMSKNLLAGKRPYVRSTYTIKPLKEIDYVRVQGNKESTLSDVLSTMRGGNETIPIRRLSRNVFVRHVPGTRVLEACFCGEEFEHYLVDFGEPLQNQ